MAADIRSIVTLMAYFWRWMYETDIKNIQSGIKSSGAGFVGSGEQIQKKEYVS